ncbi:hypothetical protein BBJ28_00020023, partial [Nothophytophthora sp. Chile5]
GCVRQMKKTRGPALNAVKQRAIQTLKRKKMFEAQRDKLSAQSFNIEQASCSLAGCIGWNPIHTGAALTGAVSVPESDVQDDMADLMEDMNEIQDIIGRIGDEVDESELEAELAGLEEEWAEEEAVGAEAEQAPSYLTPAQHHELPAAPSGAPERAGAARATDDFGLPIASAPYSA